MPKSNRAIGTWAVGLGALVLSALWGCQTTTASTTPSTSAVAVTTPPTDTSWVAMGRRVAMQHCAECHSQEIDVGSHLPAAPPFPTLYQRFPVEQIGERIEGGMMIGHPRMPLLTRLDPDEERALTAYLISFRQ